MKSEMQEITALHPDIDPLLNKMSDAQRADSLFQYLEKARNTEGTQIEIGLMEVFGLYNPKNPKKGTLYQLLETNPEYAGQVLNGLVHSGTYPEELISTLRDNGLEAIAKKRERARRAKNVWRTVRAGTKALSIVQEAGSPSEWMGQVATTFGFWGLVDRATADPKERIFARATIFTDTLKRLYQEPEDRTDTKPEAIASLVTGDSEPENDDVEIVKYWQEYVSTLLNTGVSPDAILDELRKKWIHDPRRITVDHAEQKIMSDIFDNISKLPREDNVWDSTETREHRRRVRQTLAQEVVFSYNEPAITA